MAGRKSQQQDRIRPTLESPRGSYVAIVKQNRRLCTDHYRLVLSLPHFPPSVPGQFIQLDCRDPHAGPPLGEPGVTDVHDLGPRSFEWPPPSPAARPVPADPDFTAPLAYLRRPFSIADQRVWPDGYTEIDVIHRVVGKGTLLLAQLQPGQGVSLLGPLGGGGFDVPLGLDLACLVGGGVGIPPMMYLAKYLARRNCKVAVAFIGAQRHDLLPVTFTPPPDGKESSEDGDPVLNVEEFKEYGFPAVITTDDGSLGMKGYVTQALRRFLDERQVQSGRLTNTTVYCCGPTPMMKATARVAAEFGVPCQVSLEQPMACGMGTCQSCVIRHRPHDATEAPPASTPAPPPAAGEWKYKLTCTDGPVFDSRDILW
jgi:dihydroorotate dehydrogenase electron transfer subunit